MVAAEVEYFFGDLGDPSVAARHRLPTNCTGGFRAASSAPSNPRCKSRGGVFGNLSLFYNRLSTPVPWPRPAGPPCALGSAHPPGTELTMITRETRFRGCAVRGLDW